jgi:uncharacterized protein
MDNDHALSDEEFDELDNFLLSDTLSDEAMDLSTLDGYFTAIALNPEFVLPSQWLPWIWDMENGEETPTFENEEQAERINILLLRHYNAVQDMLGEGRFAPLMYTLHQEDGSEFYDAEGWSMGFVLGVTLFQEIWDPIFDENPEWLAPVILLGTEQGWEQLEEMHKDGEDQRPAIRAAYEAIPEMVETLFQHFLPRREAAARERVTATLRRAGDKVGRNDLCPCGSGKKFKKCCGAGPTLH